MRPYLIHVPLSAESAIALAAMAADSRTAGGGVGGNAQTETAAVDPVHMPVPIVDKHLETPAQSERCDALVRSEK